MEAAAIIRRARTEAALTQQQLARRLGVTQAALAQLEKPGANPTVATLDRVLRAAGRRLELRLARVEPSVDPTLLREALGLEPAKRIATAERLLAEADSLAGAAARSRAEHRPPAPG